MKKLNLAPLDPESLENVLSNLENIDEFNSTIDYEKYIVLPKKELNNFCRIIENLTKSAIDDYGKSVLIRCLSATSVELVYVNNPFGASLIVENKSGKTVKTFAVAATTLKKVGNQLIRIAYLRGRR